MTRFVYLVHLKPGDSDPLENSLAAAYSTLDKAVEHAEDAAGPEECDEGEYMLWLHVGDIWTLTRKNDDGNDRNLGPALIRRMVVQE